MALRPSRSSVNHETLFSSFVGMGAKMPVDQIFLQVELVTIKNSNRANRLVAATRPSSPMVSRLSSSPNRGSIDCSHVPQGGLHHAEIWEPPRILTKGFVRGSCRSRPQRTADAREADQSKFIRLSTFSPWLSICSTRFLRNSASRARTKSSSTVCSVALTFSSSWRNCAAYPRSLKTRGRWA